MPRQTPGPSCPYHQIELHLTQIWSLWTPPSAWSSHSDRIQVDREIFYDLAENTTWTKLSIEIGNQTNLFCTRFVRFVRFIQGLLYLQKNFIIKEVFLYSGLFPEIWFGWIINLCVSSETTQSLCYIIREARKKWEIVIPIFFLPDSRISNGFWSDLCICSTCFITMYKSKFFSARFPVPSHGRKSQRNMFVSWTDTIGQVPVKSS